MAYISLYRKYRPQTFEDVVGQEHVTTTLRNAIIAGRIASGYLFTGTRGTAKTTCARILAKALNCIGPDGLRDAPSPEPCGVCGPCRSVASSSFVDVLEMDAASHGKVDDVRDLVASIKFPPMEGRYKVYIIDEAHQLSRDAMDAFLKTLEEPPDRVVFVLATTELDKLPITIASRCQVYEFKRGSVAQISARLSEVLRAERVQADAAAVTLIARAADGSYRDSLSLLEQVLAYQREHVTARDVTVVLGTIDDDLLSQVVDLIADSDAAGAFGLAGSILESGKDVRQFLKSLAERFRDMLFVGVGARPAAPGEMDDSAAMRAQAARFAPATLLKALETLTAAEQETKRSNQHRLLLEMALLRLMRLPSEAAPPGQPVFATPLPAPASGNGAGTHPAASGGPPAPARRASAAGTTGGRGVLEAAPDAAPALTSSPSTSSPSASSPLRFGEGGEERAGRGSPAIPYDMPPPLAEDELPDEADDEDDDPSLSALLPGDDELDSLPLDDEEELPFGEAPSLLVVSPEQHEQADDLMRVQQVAAEAPALTTPKPAPPADTPPELLRLQKSWQEVVNLTGNKSKAASKDVVEAKPVAISGNVVMLEFAQQFHFDRVNGKEALRQFIEENICKTLDVPQGSYRLKCIMEGQALPTRPVQGKVAQSLAPQSPAPAAVTAAPRAAASDAPGPFVEKVIAVFGGQLLDDDLKG